MRSFYRDLEVRKYDNLSAKWLGGIATGQRACGLQPPHQDLAWWDVTDKVETKNIKYEWITNNLTKCTRCMSTVHLTLNQNQYIPIRITLHSRYNHRCKIWTSAWTSIYLNYSINKHNAELRKTAPVAKVSCHKCSYTSPLPQNMVKNDNFIQYFLIHF